MFTAEVLRETTDGDYITETFEGVVDLKTSPVKPKVRLVFSDDRDAETVPFDNLHIESPLK